MAKEKTLTSPIIKLKNWRASFLNLVTPKAFEEGQEPRYEASFLADPTDAAHKLQILELVKAAKALCELKGWEYPKPGEEHLSEIQLPYGRADLHPKKKKYDGYAGMFYLVTAQGQKDPPVICARDPKVLLDPKKKPFPYSGCYVNTNPTLWVQDNKWGTAIRANLRIIQWVGDGKPFGKGSANPEDEFEPLPDMAPPQAAKEMEDDIPF